MSKTMHSKKKRSLKLLLALGALAGAIILSMTLGGPGGGVGGTTPPIVAAGERSPKGYNLSALKIFRSVLLRVTDNYVEPGRIAPQKMLVAALHGMERRVAEVLVKENPNRHEVTIHVQGHHKTFSLKNINSPWTLSSLLKKMLRFIEPHLQPGTEIQDIEYAAINGMLSTLDPHSLLLKPSIYDEMKLSTRGEFGGLGIVISMVQGVLTVMNPMDGTPAHKVGIKACDQILKIGQESTVNMTLSQAVHRLRGKPGTTVAITVKRPGRTKTLRKKIRRDIVQVESVESRMLAKKVAYVQLKSFQGNSYRDLKSHLAALHKKGTRGLILDLRGNPGGLLDQAIKISDLFVDSGAIVTTVSHAGKKREEKRATRQGTQSDYPLVILVNEGSASASEIVAGALKRLNRGVVIGRRTFGKGSVQVLYDNNDGSALKLTIAQYLTPGDVSIQSVGITPDISTVPMLVRKEIVHLRSDENAPGENDLSQHLVNESARKGKPALQISYLADPVPKTDDRSKRSEKKNEKASKNLCLYPDRPCRPPKKRFVEDFQIRLARDLLAQSKGNTRSEVLSQADALFRKVKAREEARVVAALAGVGVDWRIKHRAAKKTKKSASPSAKTSMSPLRVSLKTVPADLRMKACQMAELTVSVHNIGKKPIFRLAASTESSNRFFAKRDLVFGRVDPGKSRSWVLKIRLRDLPTRVDDLILNFRDASGNPYPPHRVKVAVQGVAHPVFAYGYQLIDDLGRKGMDGRPSRGERVRLLVNVRNSGQGAAFQAVTSVKNLSGPGIFIRKGRFALGRMEPGESKVVSFTFDVEKSFQGRDFKLELSVSDNGLSEIVSEKLKFSLASSRQIFKPEKGFVIIRSDQSAFRAWAAKGAPTIGYAQRGGRFALQAVAKDWYRVEAEPGRPAFVEASLVERKRLDRRGAKHTKITPEKFHRYWHVTPPTLTVRSAARSTNKKSVKIFGTARDETRVSDVFVFVRNPDKRDRDRKIYYASNENARSKKTLTFSAEVPLWEGANYITIFARENQDVQTSQTLVVHRRAPSAVLARRREPSK